MGGVRFRNGNPYDSRIRPQSWGSSRAAELPNRLRFLPRRVRAVPPILDERPLDIYRSDSIIYSIPYRIPRAYVATPEQVGA